MKRRFIAALVAGMSLMVSVGTASALSYTVNGTTTGFYQLDVGNATPPPDTWTYDVPKFVEPVPGAALTGVTIDFHGTLAAQIYLANFNQLRNNDFSGQVAATIGATIPGAADLTVFPVLWTYPVGSPYVLVPNTTWSDYFQLTGDASAAIAAGQIALFTGPGNYSFNIYAVDATDINFTTIGYGYAINAAAVAIDVTYDYTIRTVDTPEPSTFVLLGVGLAGLACLRRRK